jgi:hypothetical protein
MLRSRSNMLGSFGGSSDSISTLPRLRDTMLVERVGRRRVQCVYGPGGEATYVQQVMRGGCRVYKTTWILVRRRRWGAGRG